MNKSILFLCTGNYYRSRFAEVLFNAIASKSGLKWTATSRGLALERGVNNVGPISLSVIAALANLGIQPSDACIRFPLQVTTHDLDQANLVIALKQDEHSPLLHERYPGWAEKVEYWHIDDEPGVLALIDQEVKELFGRLTKADAIRAGI